jgi:F-type H+-transporting ATPase subunit epsilon
MKLIIAKINQKIFEGEFDSIILPGGHGELEIFPDHTPMLSSLGKGKIIYRGKGEEKKELEIEKGFVEINKNEVIVVL